MSVESESTALGKRLPWREHLVGPFRKRAIEGLVAKGYHPDDAAEMVGQIGDGTIWNWIITDGPEIEAFIAFIISLFPK